MQVIIGRDPFIIKIGMIKPFSLFLGLIRHPILHPIGSIWTSLKIITVVFVAFPYHQVFVLVQDTNYLSLLIVFAPCATLTASHFV